MLRGKLEIFTAFQFCTYCTLYLYFYLAPDLTHLVVSTLYYVEDGQYCPFCSSISLCSIPLYMSYSIVSEMYSAYLNVRDYDVCLMLLIPAHEAVNGMHCYDAASSVSINNLLSRICVRVEHLRGCKRLTFE